MRLLVVANKSKPNVAKAVDELLPWMEQKAQIVAIETDHEKDLSETDADCILALGGDGTLLSAARRLNGKPVPLMGVNFGRLGFLASFQPEEFKQAFEAQLAGTLPISTRMMLEASVVSAADKCDPHDAKAVAAKRRWSATALNDAVITAGQPFHMIELEIRVDGDGGIKFVGDGTIVATPSGSTAYNISAGGPIVDPGVEAFCVTPICPHSLSFRPVVVSSHNVVVVVASRVNPGTTLFCDGQVTAKLSKGDKVIVRRSPHDVRLIENPKTLQWRNLSQKLNWAAAPKYGEE